MSSSIYLISHPSGWCKVGYSSNVVRRLKQLESGSNDTLKGEVVFETSDPVGDEKTALDALAEFRITGEWFEISTEKAIERLRSALGVSERPFPKKNLRMTAVKQIPPTQVRIAQDLKDRIQAAANVSGRTMQKEIEFALSQQFPEVSALQEGLRYGKMWGLRWLEMGPDEAAAHPNRRMVQNIYDQCEQHGPRFRWPMVGGRPDDLDDVLEEWGRSAG